MDTKATAPDAEGWQQVGSRVAEYGGGSRGEAAKRWDNERGGFPSAFSKPRREERPAPQKQGVAPPKEIKCDSTEDFPSLGSGTKAAKAPIAAGWASKAASWAAADEVVAVAERHRLAELEEADKERRRLNAGIPDLLGRILGRRGDEVYRGGFQEPSDDYEGRTHSPPYDPDCAAEEDAEYAAAAAVAASSRGNAHLDYEEDNEGWNESR